MLSLRVLEAKSTHIIMALIKCPECDKEISDRAASCPHCGCPLVEEAPKTPIIIHGYPPSPAIMHPDVTVIVDGRIVGNVPMSGATQIEIDHDCNITFSLVGILTNYPAKASTPDEIQLKLNYSKCGGVTAVGRQGKFSSVGRKNKYSDNYSNSSSSKSGCIVALLPLLGLISTMFCFLLIVI